MKTNSILASLPLACLIVFLLLPAPPPAHSATIDFIEAEAFTGAGAGTATLDTGTNLLWADLTTSAGTSTDGTTVTNALTLQLIDNGYVVATAIQVQQQINSFFTNPTPADTIPVPQSSLETLLYHSLFGNIITFFGVQGYFLSTTDPGKAGRTIISAFPTFEQTFIFPDGHFLTETHFERGVYYVKSNISQVPIPAAVWLFGSAVASLVGFQSRNSKVSAAVA